MTTPLRLFTPDGASVTWYPTDISSTGVLNRLRIGLPNGWEVSLINHPFAMGNGWEVAAVWGDDVLDLWENLDETDVQARIDIVASRKED
jgi:hypothetical protein